MKALIQRVRQASVSVNNITIGEIGSGLVVLLCAMPTDDESKARQLLTRIARMRLFGDENGKMNLSVVDQKGGVLLVPQFTLAADVSSGTRPGFSRAAPPAIARPLFEQAKAMCTELFAQTGFGEFGADMQVSLINDGPVTIWIEQ